MTPYFRQQKSCFNFQLSTANSPGRADTKAKRFVQSLFRCLRVMPLIVLENAVPGFISVYQGILLKLIIMIAGDESSFNKLDRLIGAWIEDIEATRRTREQSKRQRQQQSFNVITQPNICFPIPE